MKVAVGIITKRKGGIDVIEASLLRQTYRDFVLFVIDEHERNYWWEKVHPEVVCIQPPFKGNRPRNLARAYNLMAQYVDEADLFISLQDYIWLPEDGIERFVECYKASGDKNLYTGLTSISADPTVEDIFDIEGAYSIFKEAWYKKPDEIAWHDARDSFYGEIGIDDTLRIIQIADPNHFEMNWAAIPVSLLRDGLTWDESYDEGIACENNKLALDAIVKYDCGIVLDRDNHAISFPHRDYFDEGEIGSADNNKNLERFQDELQKARSSQ